MTSSKLKLKLSNEKYAVCRLDSDKSIPTWCKGDNFVSITKTDEELSIVCKQDIVGEGVTCEKEWRILKVLGPLDFSLIGILSPISSVLAKNKVSIFVISTYDTDYVLVKDESVEKAIEVLENDNFIIIR